MGIGNLFRSLGNSGTLDAAVEDGGPQVLKRPKNVIAG